MMVIPRASVSLLSTVCAVALVVISGCSGSFATHPPSSSATTAPAQAHRAGRDDTPAAVPDDAQKAVVARIVDGDTLELAAVAPGPVLSSTQQIDGRLLEVDAPETVDPNEPVQCYGTKAATRLSELAPPGSTVWVQRDQELRDRYGRYLLYVWNAEGTFVNLALVKQGYAAAKLYEPNDRHWQTISAAEQAARAAGAGLWSACPYFGAPADTPQPPPQPDENDGGSAYVVPPPPPDRDCGAIAASDFPVRPGDPHRFDSDGDGLGCES